MTTHWFRKEMGLTQKELADKFGFSLATVKNWDSRNSMPVYLDKLFLEIVLLKTENETLKNQLFGGL